MTKEINTAGIKKATGRPWKEWVEFLDSIHAKDLPHKEIAEKVFARGASGWWSQSITVAYEQHIGRRMPGQDNEGEFSVSVSRTVKGTMDTTLDHWVKMVWGRTDFADVPIKDIGEISKTDKWRYWRAVLGDGSHVVVTIVEKVPGKAGFTITHEKLKSDKSVERWRAYWKEFIGDLS